MSIPKRIVQTGKNRTLSPKAKAAVTNLTLLHPDWEYIYFTDDDVRRFVASEFPHYVEIFDAFQHPIQRIDFFRYLAIFRLGGFYFDLDVFLSANLSPLLAKRGVFPFEELTINQFLRQRYGMDWEVGNYAFGAVSDHPYLEAVIENCVRAQKDQTWVAPMMTGIPFLFRPEFTVLNTTGPGLLSRTLAENSESAENLTVLFPEDVRDTGSWHQFGNYGVHLMDGSWRTRGSFLRRRLMCVWESVTKRRMKVVSMNLGPNRTLRGHRESKAPLISPSHQVG